MTIASIRGDLLLRWFDVKGEIVCQHSMYPATGPPVSKRKHDVEVFRGPGLRVQSQEIALQKGVRVRRLWQQHWCESRWAALLEQGALNPKP